MIQSSNSFPGLLSFEIQQYRKVKHSEKKWSDLCFRDSLAVLWRRDSKE